MCDDDANIVALALQCLSALCSGGCLPFRAVHTLVTSCGILQRVEAAQGSAVDASDAVYSTAIAAPLCDVLCHVMAELVDIRTAAAKVVTAETALERDPSKAHAGNHETHVCQTRCCELAAVGVSPPSVPTLTPATVLVHYASSCVSPVCVVVGRRRAVKVTGDCGCS